MFISSWLTSPLNTERTDPALNLGGTTQLAGKIESSCIFPNQVCHCDDGDDDENTTGEGRTSTFGGILNLTIANCLKTMDALISD